MNTPPHGCAATGAGQALAARTGEELVSTVTNDRLAALCPTIVLDDAQAALEIGATTPLTEVPIRLLVRGRGSGDEAGS